MTRLRFGLVKWQVGWGLTISFNDMIFHRQIPFYHWTSTPEKSITPISKLHLDCYWLILE